MVVRPLVCLGTAMLVGATAIFTQATYEWNLPAGFPVPAVPADNPMSAAKVELGRYLFYDTRLSGNGSMSCATCHQQARAFSDGRRVSVGSTREVHPRASMSLANVAYAPVLTWANPSVTSLEEQALIPMLGDHPVELGLAKDDSWLERLRRDARYEVLFHAAYPGVAGPIIRRHVVQAIASFERTLISGRSSYDRYHYDRDESAVSDAAKRGEVLFHSRHLSCFTCHG